MLDALVGRACLCRFQVWVCSTSGMSELSGVLNPTYRLLVSPVETALPRTRMAFPSPESECQNV